MKRSLKLLSLLSAAVVSMTMCLSACGEEKVAEHDHVWNAGEVTTEPTCMEDGVKTYTCTVEGCGRTKTENLGKAPHTWDEGEVTVQPTCIKEGEKTFKCKVEGCKGTKTEPIDKVAHTWGEAVVTTPATFTQPGVKTKTCTVEGCGATDTEAIAAQADFGMQFSTDPTTVETSGWSYMYYNSFDFNTDPSGWGMGADFTADAENNVWKAAGVQLSKDGFSLDGGKTVAVGFMKEAMPHAEANVEFKFATQNDGVKVYVNANEEKIYSNDNNEKSVDFTSEDPTDLGETAHTFVVVIQNTGTEKAEGSFAFTVKLVCLHAWNEGTVKTAATCKAAGEREFTCAVCGDTYTETIPQREDIWDKGVVTKQPTSTEGGFIKYTCTYEDCDNTKMDNLPQGEAQGTVHNFASEFALTENGEFGHWQVGVVDYDFSTETFAFTKITTKNGVNDAYNDNTAGWKEIKGDWMACVGMMGFAYLFESQTEATVNFNATPKEGAAFDLRWALIGRDGTVKNSDGKPEWSGTPTLADKKLNVEYGDMLYILVNKTNESEPNQCDFTLSVTIGEAQHVEPFAGANFKTDFEVNDQGEFNGWQVGRIDYHFPGDQPQPTDETFDFTKLTESNDNGDGYVYKDGGDTKFEIKNDWMICKNMMGFAYTFGTAYNGKFDFKLERALTDGKFTVRWAVKGSDGVIKTNDGKASWGGKLESDAPFTLNEQISVQSGDTLYVLVNHENGSDQCKYEFTIGDSTQPPVTEQEIANYHDDFKLDDSGNWVYGYATDYNLDTNGFTFNTDLTANSGEGQWNTSDKKIKIKNDYFESDDGKNVTVGYKVQPGQTPNKITVTFNGSDNPEANPRYAIRVVIKGSDGNVKSCKIDDSGATQATWSYTADDLTAEEGDTIYVVFFRKDGWQQGKFQITISQA